jgi:hypothetical protein
MKFEKVAEVCHGYTVNGFNDMARIANKPLRFIYTSSVTVSRDQTKRPLFHSDYCLMRVGSR